MKRTGKGMNLYFSSNKELEQSLERVWQEVKMDVLDALGGRASWEDIADEIVHQLPEKLNRQLSLLTLDEQDKLFKKVFGPGRRY